MNEKNLIHVKLNYEEVFQSKKSMLLLEMNLLNIIKTIRKYYSLRNEELKLKSLLERKIRSFSSKMNTLHKILPKSEARKTLKIKEEKEIKEKKVSYDESLESQLREIQEKLKYLGS